MKAGYFLVLSMSSADEGATVKTSMTESKLMHEEVEVDDGFCVYYITDKNKQKIKISAEGGSGEKNEVTLGLSHLVLEN